MCDCKCTILQNLQMKIIMWRCQHLTDVCEDDCCWTGVTRKHNCFIMVGFGHNKARHIFSHEYLKHGSRLWKSGPVVVLLTFWKIIWRIWLPGLVSGHCWVFQQDNNMWHTSMLTLNLLKDPKIKVLEWPKAKFSIPMWIRGDVIYCMCTNVHIKTLCALCQSRLW